MKTATIGQRVFWHGPSGKHVLFDDHLRVLEVLDDRFVLACDDLATYELPLSHLSPLNRKCCCDSCTDPRIDRIVAERMTPAKSA